jgi:hypothetical protein
MGAVYFEPQSTSAKQRLHRPRGAPRSSKSLIRNANFPRGALLARLMRCPVCRPTGSFEMNGTPDGCRINGFFEEIIMSALRKALVVETRESWTPVVIAGSAGKASEAKAEPAAASTPSLFKNMALFLSAPFVGLLYAILLPFVGLGMLAWFAAKALHESPKARKALRFGKRMLLIAAAPFAGLVYVIALPFVGLGMLTWFGATALMASPPAK